MDEGYFIPYLKELAAKYSVADELNVTLDRGRIIIDCSKGKFAFVYDFALLKEGREGCTVPLLHWRSKRRSVELRNIVKTGMVEKPLAMRIHHIVPRGSSTAPCRISLPMRQIWRSSSRDRRWTGFSLISAVWSTPTASRPRTGT